MICRGARRGERLGIFDPSAFDTNALQLCHSPRVELFSFMPTEISIPDAEDLKSRVRELWRFL